jgi:beta-N-acetylhexosaminidase
LSAAAAIVGCSGPVLSKTEKAFFADAEPWGFILFGRNIETPQQVRRLTAALRDAVGRDDAPILVDQEGGRVQRLGPPHWRRYPPARAYAELAANDSLATRELARLGGRLMAHDLRALGINIDCAPVLDVPDPDGHEVIGDRAYAKSAALVAVLGRATAEGLIAGGVLPVIKHMPGHGRAHADSHKALPVVEADWEELEARDFAPFRALSDMPIAMTAHVVFAAIDRKRPATVSKRVVRGVIRQAIGFDGLLVSDDLSMQALSGSLRERAEQALKAGCDVVLHCSGVLREMKAVMAGTGSLKGRAERRAAAALGRIPKAVEPFDVAAGHARFDAAFAGRWAS